MAEPEREGGTPSRLNTDSDLPPVNTQRWSPRRKAMIVDAVRSGALSFAAACERYQLSAEELTAWQNAMENHGTPGLRVTRLQIYRKTLPARPRGGASRATGDRRAD